MEMAMAGNQGYMNRFYEAIDNKRFAMIISPPNSTMLRGTTATFGEENDTWVKSVSIPLAKDYRVRKAYKDFGFEVLIPKP
jgi:hypothetical protein